MSQPSTPRRIPARLLAAVALLPLVVSCTARSTSSPSPEPTPIPQPGLPKGVHAAPDSDRVDLTVPRFSDPTEVTNPLFPVSDQASVVFAGHVDDLPFRTEVTLLPDTRIVQWGGQRIECLVSQYTAFLDGRLQEVAYDLYAQADDGSVWYFGEDVADLVDGSVVTKEGTWLAGKDGPAQMIMPGDPQVGDVYRAENIPGIAWEQVTVRTTGERLPGPLGPVDGGMVGEELHMDNTTELKQFAPGYGEFYTGSEGDVEALALAVPTDAADGPMPRALGATLTGLLRALDRAEHHQQRAAATAARQARAAWAAVPEDVVPRLIEPRVDRTMVRLGHAVAGGDARRTRQAAIEAARWTLDIQLRYRPVQDVDVARFELWAAQLRLDADAGDQDAVRGDVFSLFYLRDRIQHGLPDGERTRVNDAVGTMQEAVVDGDLEVLRRAATRLDLAGGVP